MIFAAELVGHPLTINERGMVRTGLGGDFLTQGLKEV